MKLIRICPEPVHLNRFREAHKEKLSKMSFDEQMTLYRKENIVLPGGWADGMRSEGFDVFEVVYSDVKLMARWALENGCSNLLKNPNFPELILVEMVRRFNPDCIFIYAGAFYRIDTNLQRTLVEACSSPPLLTGLWGDELMKTTTYQDYFKYVDFMFCSSRLYEEKFKQANIPAQSIGACFDDSIKFNKIIDKKHKVIFAGATGYGFVDHKNRYNSLLQLMKETDLEIWTDEPIIRLEKERKIKLLNYFKGLSKKQLKFLKKFIIFRSLKKWIKLVEFSNELDIPVEYLLGNISENWHYYYGRRRLSDLYPSRSHNSLPNASDYYGLIASASIVINLHRDEDADVGNIRCFEVTGLGSLLLTDRGKELSEFFEPGIDFISFETVEECKEKISYLLSRPELIESVAKSGQKKTLENHTLKNRIKVIAAVIKEKKKIKIETVYANWDTSLYPISFDIAFFVEAAQIYRKKIGAKQLIINVIHPVDQENIVGISKKSGLAVGKDNREFRIRNIVCDVARLFQNVAVNEVVDRSLFFKRQSQLKYAKDYINFPEKNDFHHRDFYRAVNDNPHEVTGFKASRQARIYIENWLSKFKDKKIITISLRYYKLDPERNSNLDEWFKFASSLDKNLYEVVIVPDVEQLDSFHFTQLANFSTFWIGSIHPDLRYALYESAYLNLFVNNGPGTVATLNKDIKMIMFKLVVPTVPHCTIEFIESQGFQFGQSPKYCGPYQKWVWENDEYEIILREFNRMIDKMRSL